MSNQPEITIASKTAPDGWIRVDERLPSPEDFDTEGNIWCGNSDWGWVEIANIDDDWRLATHWKPTGLTRPSCPAHDAKGDKS